MVRTHAIIPVTEKIKNFCNFMGYEQVSSDADLFYFKIPAGHICRLHLNAERWERGEFNKEKFLQGLC